MVRGKRKESPDAIANVKDDVLEVISIGTIYTGPLDKKYWSCSRGKDRYPYPIGYNVVRIHSGKTYRMEIRDNSNGPLFVVTSSDGISCSGHTPNTVWDNYKKKSSPMVKNSGGRRLSGDIDGVELFGFRNLSVQRLLRGLLVECNETTQQSFMFSNLHDGTSYIDNENETQAICSPNNNNLRHPLGELVVSSDDKIAKNEQPFYDKACVLDEGGNYALEDDLHTEPQDRSWLVGEQIFHKGQIDAQTDAEFDKKSSRRIKNNFIEPKVSKQTLCNADLSVCIPDTLDCIEDKLDWSEQGGPLGGLSKKIDELIACEIEDASSCGCAIPLTEVHKELVTEIKMHISASADAQFMKTYPVVSPKDESEGIEVSQPLHDASSDSPFTSSENISSDCDGKLDASMIMLLLPRALPLMQTYKRKRKRSKVQETKSDQPLCPNGLSNKGTAMTKFSAQGSEQDAGNKDDAMLVEGVTLLESPEVEKTSFNCKGSESFTKLQSMENIKSEVPASFGTEHGNALHRMEENYNRVVRVASSSPRKDKDTNLKNRVSRNINENDKYAANDSGKLCIVENSQIASMSYDVENINTVCQDTLDMQLSYLKRSRSSPELDGLPPSAISLVPNKLFTNGPSVTECTDGASQMIEGDSLGSNVDHVREILAYSNRSLLFNSITTPWEHLHCNLPCRKRLIDGCCSKDATDNVCKDYLKLRGCYEHPFPVLSLFFISNEDELQIGVLSGFSECVNKSLFIYKFASEQQSIGVPSFLGYTHITFPAIQHPLSEKIKFERCGLQFSLDGQFLILLNGLKVPCCRDQKANCLCSVCTSVNFSNNGITIVLVQFGYVSIIRSLRTKNIVFCLLLCKGNHLVAVEEGGELHVWMMTTDWRTTIEEFFIPGLSQGLVLEVKRIPCSDTIIIGHNGVGEFGLWDISKRIRLARFSFPGYSIFEFLPVSLFNWRELIVSNELEAHEHVQGVTGKQVHWPYQGRENDGDEVAVWILVSESSNFEHHHQMKGCQTTQRLGLALLAEGAFVLGSALDSRVSALEVSRGHGILGTSDGQLYMWNLSSGEMVFNANSCSGGSISCIAADEKSGSLLVASNNNVLLYAPTNEISRF